MHLQELIAMENVMENQLCTVQTHIIYIIGGC